MAINDIYRLRYAAVGRGSVAVHEFYHKQIGEAASGGDEDELKYAQAFFGLQLGHPWGTMELVLSGMTGVQVAQVQKVRPILGRPINFFSDPILNGGVDQPLTPGQLTAQYSWGSAEQPIDTHTNRFNMFGMAHGVLNGMVWDDVFIQLLLNVGLAIHQFGTFEDPELATYRLQYRRNPSGLEEDAEYTNAYLPYLDTFPRRMQGRTPSII